MTHAAEIESLWRHGRREQGVSTESEELSQLQRAYAEYGELSGYLEREYSVEWQDEAGNTWRKTCTVINLGRPDRGVPVDPDAQLDTEKMPRTPDKRMRRVERYIREHGPSNAQDIADALSMNYKSVSMQLNAADGTVYCRYDKDGNVVIWGVCGVHDKSQ